MESFEFACGKGGDLGRWIAGLRYGRQRHLWTTWSIQRAGSTRDDQHRRQSTHGILPDGRRHTDASLDEITDAMLTSKHPEILSALWNIDKDANPALDKFKGLALKGFDTVSCQFAVHYLFKTDDTLDRFVNGVHHQGRRPLHRHHFRRRHCCRAAEKNSGKITGQVGDLVVEYRARVRGTYTEGTGQMVDVYVETIGQVLREYLVSFKTQRLKSQGFELVETEMFGDAKRLQEDPE
jgi:hypothetical protein